MSRTIFAIAVALIGATAIGASASGSRYVTDCNKAKSRPASITITCGDANAALIKLHWSSWGGAKAHASGTFAYNDCVPSCAAGSGKQVPATATLSGTRRCKGRTFYKLLVIHFTARVPKGYHRTDPWTLGCPHA